MEKELSIRGKKLFCRFLGKGDPVILVHGFGEDGNIWKDQASFLQLHYRVIIPDLPGSGRSEIVEDMSMEGLAEILKLMLDNAGAYSGSGKICMIGHSMGGYIALAFAEKYPALLNGFGLFHSTAYADSDEKKETRRKGIAFIEQHGAFEFLRTSTPNLFSAKTRDERPELVNEQIGILRNFSAQALVLYYQAMMQRPDRKIVIEKATVPVLFIIGKDDNAIPMKDMLEQSQLPENAYIHILPDSGHMGMLEESLNSSQILNKYLGDIYPKHNSDQSDQ